MIDDGLYARFGTPAVVLGQHVAPIPAGVIGLHVGAAFAAADSLTVTLHGQGAHGSRPEASVDPIVMAAATVLRVQTIVSREVPAGETAVVTIGTLHAGTAVNIISDRAELGSVSGPSAATCATRFWPPSSGSLAGRQPPPELRDPRM